MTTAAVRAAVEACIIDASNPLSLQHYGDRIGRYYEADEAGAAALLDGLATAPGPLARREILTRAQPHAPGLTEDGARRLLRRLEQDHDLRRDGDTYAFRGRIVLRWWRYDRGLPTVEVGPVAANPPTGLRTAPGRPAERPGVGGP